MLWHGTCTLARTILARHGAGNPGTARIGHGMARKILARKILARHGTEENWCGKSWYGTARKTLAQEILARHGTENPGTAQTRHGSGTAQKTTHRTAPPDSPTGQPQRTAPPDDTLEIHI